MTILRELDSDELHAEIEKLFKARGAGHNFQLGVLAAAHALISEDNAELRHQILTGMVHIQASVMTMTTNEVSILSQGLKSALEVSDEEIKAAGEAVDEMIKNAQGQQQ